MNRILKSTLLFFILIGLFSCQKDDSTTTTIEIPYWQLAPIDDAAIVSFLTNNYFNEEEFNNAGSFDPGVFKYDIKFSEDSEVTGYDSNGDGVIDVSDIDNTTVFNRTPLINYLISDENDNSVFKIVEKIIYVEGVAHTLYILKINQGSGSEQPKFCDEALVSYEGMTLLNDVFDNALNPVKLDLASTVKGFSESVSEFNIAATVTPVGDGTFTYSDFGVGAVFMPSGLGYYSGSAGSISAYTPLIFKLKVYGETELDHDDDGVPTYVEDLNGDHYLNNDDSDLDGVPNYLDVNDDNDPILTIDEENIVIVVYPPFFNGGTEPVLGVNEYEVNRDVDDSVEPNIITITTATYTDTDLDGIPNYLDADS